MENDWLAERDRARRVRKQHHAKLQLLLVFLSLVAGLLWVWWESKQIKLPSPAREAVLDHPVVSEKTAVFEENVKASVVAKSAAAESPAKPPQAPAISSNPVEGEIGDVRVELKPTSGSPPEPLRGRESELPKEEEAWAALSAFVRAESLEAKSGLVLRKPGQDERMTRYYVTSRRSDPDLGTVLSSETVVSHGRTYLCVRFESKSSASGVGQAFLSRDSDGVVRLDWESYVGHGTLGWSEFQQSRTQDEVALRAFVSVDDYFNYEFTDALKYLSFRLKSADGKMAINGFAVKGSAVALAMERAIQVSAKLKAPVADASGRVWVPLIVKVQFPPNANSDHCVQLTRLVADGWLVPPGVVE